MTLDVAPPGVEARPARSRRRVRSLTMVAVVLAVAPILAAAVSLFGRHWFPSGDQALQILRIRDVGTAHTPLLGAWSRWGWSHPGPAEFYALAPFERLFGATGVLVGTALLNAVFVAAVVLVAARRGGTQLALLAGLMMAVLVRALGLDLLVDPWNPWAAFLPFVLFVLLAWSVLCRDRSMLPLAVLVGSYAVQAHAGYLPFVGPLLCVAVGYAVVDAVRSREPGRDRRDAVRWLVVAGAIGVAVWLPPLVQQLFGDHGNVAAMASYVRHPNEPSAGWELAWGTLGEELRPVAPWVTGNDDNGLGLTAVSAVWPGAVTLLAVAGAGVLAWRRGHRDAAILTAIAVVAAGLAVLSASRLTGGFFVYATRWWWAVAAVATLALVWALVKVVDGERLRRVITALTLAGMAVAGMMTIGDLPVSVPLAAQSHAVAMLSPPTAAALDHDTRYLVRGFDFTELEYTSRGLFLELERRGFHVFAEPLDVANLRYGSWRLATAADVDAVVTLTDVAEPSFHPDPGSRLLASYDPLSPAERARELQLEATVRAEMGAHAPDGRVLVDTGFRRYVAEQGGASPADVEELGRLQARGNGYAVYLSLPA